MHAGKATALHSVAWCQLRPPFEAEVTPGLWNFWIPIRVSIVDGNHANGRRIMMVLRLYIPAPHEERKHLNMVCKRSARPNSVLYL